MNKRQGGGARGTPRGAQRDPRIALGFAALLMGLTALYLVFILTALHAVGTDDALYFREQSAANVLPTAGLSEEDLRMLDGALADYLSGNEDALWLPSADSHVRFTPPVSVFGAVQPAFNEKEMTHMRDCYDLFALLRRERGRLIVWAVLLIAGGAYWLRDRRRIRFAAWVSPLILMIPLGIFGLWALIHFNSAFNFFHKVLFRNDLWLLDPRTDLLIRICPQSMFAHMVARIALYGAIAMLGVPALTALLMRIIPKGKEESTWNNRDMRRRAAQRRIDPKRLRSTASTRGAAGGTARAGSTRPASRTTMRPGAAKNARPGTAPAAGTTRPAPARKPTGSARPGTR